MRKIGFQLWSANLVFAFIGVFQPKIFGWACSKRRCNAANTSVCIRKKLNVWHLEC